MTHEQDRAAAISAAIAKDYPADELTGSGAPSVDALNDRMEPGFERVTSKERDAAWAQHNAHDAADAPAASTTDADAADQPLTAETVAEQHDNPDRAPNDAETVETTKGDDPEAAADMGETVEPSADMVRVTVTKASMSPVPLYVHGLGRFSLPHGVATLVPREALGALDDSDVQYSSEEV